MISGRPALYLLSVCPPIVCLLIPVLCDTMSVVSRGISTKLATTMKRGQRHDQMVNL